MPQNFRSICILFKLHNDNISTFDIFTVSYKKVDQHMSVRR